MENQKFLIKHADSESIALDVTAKAKSLALCSSHDARKTLDYSLAVSHSVLPLGYTGQNAARVLQIAVPVGAHSEIARELKFATGTEVACNQVNRDILQKAIQIAYRSDDIWLESNLDLLDKSTIADASSFSDEISDKAAVPKALKALLEYSLAKEASDIHLVPNRDGLIVKLRINGELFTHNSPICNVETAKRLINRIKILSGLKTDEKNLPQDGAFTLNLRNQSRQFRVSLMPTIHGEKCVLRITSEALAFSINTLGFSNTTQDIIETVLYKKSGLVLLTGSTGSGKTTTLYSFTKNLLKRNLSITSVEDPVETLIEGVSQTSLASQKGLDYPTALKSILRQDPDVILIGEIRDQESARLVVSAALTGHLVLSTVHGSTVKDAVIRLEQLGVDRNLLGQVIKLIIKQSLAKKLCEKCKVIDLLASNQHGFKVFKSVGCPACDYSGYNGRLLTAERMYFESVASFDNFTSCFRGDYMSVNGYESEASYHDQYLRSGFLSI